MFVAFMIKQLKPRMEILASGGTFKEISKTSFSQLEIPLPPLDVQRQIVDEIASYQRIIDGARQVVDNWKPDIAAELQDALPEGIEEFPIVTLGELCSFMTGGTPASSIRRYYDNGTIPWLVSGDIHKGEIIDCEGRITEDGANNSNAKVLPKNSVLIALNGQGKTRGTVAILRMQNATCNQSLVSMNPLDREKLSSDYLYYFLKSKYQQIRDITGDNQRSGLNIPILKILKIQVPPIEMQHKIIERLNFERQIVDSNHELIRLYEAKIRRAVARVWEG